MLIYAAAPAQERRSRALVMERLVRLCYYDVPTHHPRRLDRIVCSVFVLAPVAEAFRYGECPGRRFRGRCARFEVLSWR